MLRGEVSYSCRRRSSTETVYSIQGQETDYVRDTTDTEFGTDVEYEPNTDSDEEEQAIDCGDSSGDSGTDIISTKVIAVTVLEEGSEFADSEKETEESDSELDMHDYWKCAQCNAKNNTPRYRYCQKCFKVRKNFFPPRPQRKSKWKKNEPIKPTLSQDSGIESLPSQPETYPGSSTTDIQECGEIVSKPSNSIPQTGKGYPQIIPSASVQVATTYIRENGEIDSKQTKSILQTGGGYSQFIPSTSFKVATTYVRQNGDIASKPFKSISQIGGGYTQIIPSTSVQVATTYIRENGEIDSKPSKSISQIGGGYTQIIPSTSVQVATTYIRENGEIDSKPSKSISQIGGGYTRIISSTSVPVATTYIRKNGEIDSKPSKSISQIDGGYPQIIPSTSVPVATTYIRKNGEIDSKSSKSISQIDGGHPQIIPSTSFPVATTYIRKNGEIDSKPSKSISQTGGGSPKIIPSMSVQVATTDIREGGEIDSKPSKSMSQMAENHPQNTPSTSHQAAKESYATNPLKRRRSDSLDRSPKRFKSNHSDSDLDSDTQSNEVQPLAKTVSDPSITIEEPLMLTKKVLSNTLKEVIDDDNMCIICFNEPKSGVFVHGRVAHICCCYKCAVKVWSISKRCPVCNSKVSNVLKAVIM